MFWGFSSRFVLIPNKLWVRMTCQNPTVFPNVFEQWSGQSLPSSKWPLRITTHVSEDGQLLLVSDSPWVSPPPSLCCFALSCLIEVLFCPYGVWLAWLMNLIPRVSPLPGTWKGETLGTRLMIMFAWVLRKRPIKCQEKLPSQQLNAQWGDHLNCITLLVNWDQPSSKVSVE